MANTGAETATFDPIGIGMVYRVAPESDLICPGAVRLGKIEIGVVMSFNFFHL